MLVEDSVDEKTPITFLRDIGFHALDVFYYGCIHFLAARLDNVGDDDGGTLFCESDRYASPVTRATDCTRNKLSDGYVRK